MKLLLLGLALLTVALPANAKVQIVWGTDVWPGFAEPDGTGFYQELIALVFPEDKFNVDIQYLAWKRVSWNLKRRNIDMTGGLHKSSDFLLSEMPVLSERILLLLREDSELGLHQEPSLQNAVGAYRSGYEDDIFHEIVPKGVPGVPVDSPLMAINLMENGKIDYYVELESLLQSDAADLNSRKITTQQIGTFHLYWAFVNSQKGKYIKHHFDRMFRTLKETGQLSQLYKKYGLAIPGSVAPRNAEPLTP